MTQLKSIYLQHEAKITQQQAEAELCQAQLILEVIVEVVVKLSSCRCN